MDKKMYNIVEKFMSSCMNDSAHDSEHIFRVLYQSLNIASKRMEKINYKVLITSSLLHDIGREKQYNDPKLCHAEIGGLMAKEFLLKNNWLEEEAEHVNKCISSHRFRGDNIPDTIEAKILFDSDKLDAVGFLGIARTLLYEGHFGYNLYSIKNGEIIHGEQKTDEETFLKEYNQKLKTFYGKFYTEEAKEQANKYKGYAELFYDKLVEQVEEAYKSKEKIGFITRPHIA